MAGRGEYRQAGAAAPLPYLSHSPDRHHISAAIRAQSQREAEGRAEKARDDMRGRGIAVAMAVLVAGVPAGAMAQSAGTVPDSDFMYKHPPLELPRPAPAPPNSRPYTWAGTPSPPAPKTRFDDITGRYSLLEQSDSYQPLQGRERDAKYGTFEWLLYSNLENIARQNNVDPVIGKSLQLRR